MIRMVLIQKTDDFSKIQNIRIKIFNQEMGLSNDDIFDEDDMKLEQFLIINEEGNTAVGTFRLRELVIFIKLREWGFYQSIDPEVMEDQPWIKSRCTPRKQESQRLFWILSIV